MDRSNWNWDLNDLKQVIPAEVCNAIFAIPVPSFAHPQDKLVYLRHKSGNATAKAAFWHKVSRICCPKCSFPDYGYFRLGPVSDIQYIKRITKIPWPWS